MRRRIVYLPLALLLLAGACDQGDKLDDFLRPAPVEPLAEIIRTAAPLGHFAMVAMADQMGYPIPYEKINLDSGFSVIRLTPSENFPLVYQDESCREVLILRFPVDEDLAIISIFYICGNLMDPPDKIIEIHTIPVMADDGKIKAVFASQDIYVRDSVELNVQMGPGNIRIELDRLEEPRPESTEAAIEQNAWIIDVDPAGTWDAFWDDSYTLTGGEQDVSVLTGESYSNTSVIQMAMIEATLRPACILAPVEGHAVLREVSLETSGDESIKDLVLGTVFFRFTAGCTGKVDVPLATGNFVASTGTKVDLNLLH